MTTAPLPVIPAQPSISRNHLPGLDGIRGLAILMVMLSHFVGVGGNLDAATPFNRLMQSGYLGVDLFFVLSGFLITGILLDSKTSPKYFQVFYIRRALRIFPLYYGLLAVTWLTVLFISPTDKVVLKGNDSMAWYWLYASNIGMALKGDWLASPTWVELSHFWSLAVEEQFYLVWPLLVFLLPVKRLKWLCLGIIVASPLINRVLPQWIGLEATYVSTFNRLGVLAAGGWLAIQWRTPGAWERLKPWLPVIGMASFAILLLERSYWRSLWLVEGSIMLVAGGAAVGLAASGAGGWTRGYLLESRFLRWMGKYSYGIYVYHHALRPVWKHFLWESWIAPHLGSGWPATWCYTALATAASLILAWLSWVGFEGPLLALKSRFSYREKRTPAKNPERER